MKLLLLLVTIGAAGFGGVVLADTRVADRIATPQELQTPYNGKFVFARLRHTDRFSGFRGRGGNSCDLDAPWGHDYPCAEQNLMAILSHATSLRPGSETGNIIDIGDPELHKYPIAYLSHPDDWEMDKNEIENLRAYLLKGGFIIFDDFPAGGGGRFGRGRGGGGWAAFYSEMKRVLPELEPVQLEASHPIFHSFFDFESLANLYNTTYDVPPVFVGYFEDNDPSKRMLAIVNYQNDLGENWQYSDRGFNVIPEATNEAFKFGVNYILYGLTH